MPPFSLFSPMQGLPWYLLPVWPLIFWRIQRLKVWFRAKGGPGSQMLWAVTKTGRVVLIRLSDDFYPRPRMLLAPVSDRLRQALNPEPHTPCPLRMQGRLPESGQSRAASLHPQGTRRQTLPLPEP